MPLIVDAINSDSDRLRLFFGIKTFRKILSLGNERTIIYVIDRFTPRLAKRLVHLLGYQHMQDVASEVLWALVNLTSVKTN